MGGEGVEDAEYLSLENTPTWMVAGVCTVIVFTCLGVERVLHLFGKILMKKKQKPLFGALQKIKEELMLLGFISLMLVLLEGTIQRICIPERFDHIMDPCKRQGLGGYKQLTAIGGTGRRRLLSGNAEARFYCERKGKVPLLSLEAIHQMHLFIFVLAVTHVLLSALTMLISGAKIRQWKKWEDSIQEDNRATDPGTSTPVHEEIFIQERLLGCQKHSKILSWLLSFRKQFYGSVTKSDYSTMRLSFIMTHCKSNPKFDFYKYMVRTLEADFKKVVGISWYLWVFVILFLLLNIHGWHTYFWMTFFPLILLLAVGAKLEHIISQLAHEVFENTTVIEGDLLVTLSDYHFWFNQPKIVIYLIHFILFENAFEVAIFFWILTTYGFDSCIMGQVGYIIPRIVISVITQLLCIYVTLPLYVIVTQMGSSFKRAIFEEHVEEKIQAWADKARSLSRQRASSNASLSTLSSMGSRLHRLFSREDSTKEGKINPIELNEVESID